MTAAGMEWRESGGRCACDIFPFVFTRSNEVISCGRRFFIFIKNLDTFGKKCYNTNKRNFL